MERHNIFHGAVQFQYLVPRHLPNQELHPSTTHKPSCAFLDLWWDSGVQGEQAGQVTTPCHGISGCMYVYIEGASRPAGQDEQ